MNFRTRDGLEFQGATAREAAEALRAASWQPERDLREWMRRTAAAARLQTGRAVRHHNPDVFLADLESAGLIERVDG
jgi:hypothetical protein